MNHGRHPSLRSARFINTPSDGDPAIFYAGCGIVKLSYNPEFAIFRSLGRIGPG
jgi:hypothetical protein